MSSAVSSLEDVISQIKAPPDISLDCTVVEKGIDNYHADVEVSAAFTLRVKEAVEQSVKAIVSGKQLMSGNSETMHEVRDAYTDLVKVTLHRCKTDLKPVQVSFLQFGIVKFVIGEVRSAIEKYGEQLDETLGQQKYAGSRSLLVTQEKMTWFRKHRDEFLFRVTRLFLRQLQREENNQLKALREQVVGDFPEAANVLYNPLLFGRTPKDPLLLLDYYAVWPNQGADFEKLNETLEAGFRKQFPKLPFEPLKSTDKPGQAEVYDEFGGLFAAQSILGQAEDQKETVHESFSWLEHPGNARLLFDEKVHQRHLDREDLGFMDARGLKGDLKKLQKIAEDLKKSIGDVKTVRLMLSGYALREKLSQSDLDLIDLEDAMAFVSGNDSRKVEQMVDGTAEGGALLQSRLEEAKAEFEQSLKDSEDELTVRLLTDFCRYRLHLKYYRLAHRMFNRLSVITDPEKIHLAKSGGNLYRLMSSHEVKDIGADEQPEIVHHTILKADVRGSTTVTNELMKQGLNPASYFSLRFFDPINAVLKTYGSVKVFIEGDAVILGHYEYNNAPDEWFSVSRACGMAKEMLDIVNSKNTHSRQTGLPALEIGIGICYSGDKPLFLFDDKRAIMISSAIGDADRMSSCSWKLRDVHDPGNFQVGVFELGEGEQTEKGQEYLRYNVNGIVIDEAAFEKLQTEVHFRKLNAKSGDTEENFFVGQYPDVAGKQRDMVVREGKVGVFKNGETGRGVTPGLYYYEVLPNSKFASQIVELANKKTA